MSEKRFSVLAVAAHPVQYMAPIFRRMAMHPQLDLRVAYCSLRGAEAGVDPEFGQEVKWDVPLLEGYEWIHVPNKGSGQETFWGLYNPGLREIIRAGKFDAVLCFTGYVRATFWIAKRAAKKAGTAFLFGTDATSLDARDGKAWKRMVKRFAWPLLFRMADQVLTPSAAGMELMRSLGIAKERITLTPFVADNDWWLEQSARVDRKAVRDSWNVLERELVVLFCAKLQPWKRPLDVLRAFARAQVPETVLVIAGDGSQRAELETEADTLGIASRVRFLGFVNQSSLPAVYSSADLFVLPSEYDPCPVVVCEAMLCGCPAVISDRIRGRFDLVKPGETGEIFAVGDIEALAGIMRNVLEQRSLLSMMSQKARERMETWTPRENVAAMVEAISRAVRRLSRFAEH
jgi:glycosyltransferase involved in cell wall biosynthesis